MKHIGSVSGTGSAATLSLTSIPNTYNSLVLKGVGHSTNTGINSANIRFNSDSNSNYDFNRGGRYDNANLAFQSENQTAANFAYLPNASDNVGTMLMQLEMNIWSYQQASTRPGRVCFMCQANYHYSTTKQINFLYTGWFDGSGPGNADDVTSIQLDMVTGNWGSNTKFDLYGRVDS
jgi:hypothetical protein